MPGLLFAIGACTTAHTVEGDTGPFDGFAVDTTVRDGGTDSSRADASGTDGGGDAAARTCSLTVGERQGEPCFCHGPIAASGEVLYRQAVGLEVFDVSGPAPVLVGEVDERAGSEGGLAIHAAHLVSVRNHRARTDGVRT